MTAATFVLILVIVTALAFDFTNGFHDTGNSMSTSIATGALKPKVAVAICAVLNLVGAFLSVAVALTVTKDVLHLQGSDGALLPGITAEDGMVIIFSGLAGGILWNLATWLLGLPSSSSHALFGGLIGGGIAALGLGGVNWTGVLTKIVIPAVLSPIIAGVVAATATSLVYRMTRKTSSERRERGFRIGQIGTSSLVSLAHGTGDAQKTMGVITLALVVHGSITAGHVQSDGIPMWVIVCCALAIASGTYVGGWRIIRTMGKGLVEIDSPQGMSAEASTAAIVLTSSHLGMALSTTHVATGSILGSGVGRRGAAVRWGVAGRMAIAWLVTMPSAAAVGGACYLLAHGIGGLAGVLVVFALLVASAAWLYARSRRQPVTATNVNDDWAAGPEPVEPRVESLVA